MDHAERLELLIHACGDLGAREREVFSQREGHVVEHVEGVEQGGVLEHHAHLDPHLGEGGFLERQDILAVDLDAPGVRPLEHQKLTQEHGLAGAADADQYVGRSAHHVEGDAPQDRVLVVALLNVDHANVHVPWGGARGLGRGGGGHGTRPCM
ncbi:MAG: hypothetical protein QM778_38740 [Myxococcales bacterium]